MMHLLCVWVCVCVCVCVQIQYVVCVLFLSDQCSNKQKRKIRKINPQCRNSTSFSCLALWFLSLYSASLAGVSGTFRLTRLSLFALPNLNLQTYLLRTVSPLHLVSLRQVLLLAGVCGDKERAQVRTRRAKKHTTASAGFVLLHPNLAEIVSSIFIINNYAWHDCCKITLAEKKNVFKTINILCLDMQYHQTLWQISVTCFTVWPQPAYKSEWAELCLRFISTTCRHVGLNRVSCFQKQDSSFFLKPRPAAPSDPV